MNEVLSERVTELERLAVTIRSGLEQAEAMIPALNDRLNELAMLGVASHQVEGPGVYARPAGLAGSSPRAKQVFSTSSATAR